MIDNIELYCVNSTLGYDIIRAPEGKLENAQIIGRLLNLDSLVEYIHLSQDDVSICVRKDGTSFRVPQGETVHIFTQDRLYFPNGTNHKYWVEIRGKRDSNNDTPIRSDN